MADNKMRRQTLYRQIRAYCFKQAVRRKTGTTADWVKIKLERLTWHVCKSLSPTKPYMKVCGCWTLTTKVFHLCQTRQYIVECSYDNQELPVHLSTWFFRVYKSSHANKMLSETMPGQEKQQMADNPCETRTTFEAVHPISIQPFTNTSCAEE